jgi:putative MATE family efflux protein
MESRMTNLWKYILPTVAGSCSTFLYVVVDGIFVGQGVGVDALGAVNLAMPFTLLMGAFAILMAIGGVTITAIRIGRGDTKGANDSFMHAMVASLLIAVIMMAIGMVFSKQVAVISGANDTFLAMTSEYIFYCSAFSFPLIFSVIIQGFIRNDGSPVLVGVAVITAALANVFLDWLFIFPFHMGVKGAAIASGIGEISGVLIMMTHFIRRKGVLRFQKCSFSLPLIGKILKRGLPEMISQFGTPITTLCMNYVLIDSLGDIAVSAFGVISYLFAFSMGIFFGVSEGLQPLFGQSYGRRNESDLRYYFRAGLIINLISSCVIYAVFVIFGKYICSLFNSDTLLIQTAAAALPEFGWAFLLVALNLITSSYFYSTKRTVQAVVLALCRCVAFNSLVILLLPAVFGKGIIWYTAGIAELLSFIVAVALLKYSERNGILFH